MKDRRFHICKITLTISACTLLLTGLVWGGWKFTQPTHEAAAHRQVFGSAASAALTLAEDPPAAQEEIKVLGDYDGDGEIDEAVWRTADGYWVIRRSSDHQTQYISWGMRDDVPVPDDYDGDHKTDLAVWRPSDGVWYIIRVRSVVPTRANGASAAIRPSRRIMTTMANLIWGSGVHQKRLG